jgi:pilus assembly protein CpaF
MQEIFRYVREGVDPQGNVIGSFRATGIRPRFLAELRAAGIDLPGSYFDPSSPL